MVSWPARVARSPRTAIAVAMRVSSRLLFRLELSARGHAPVGSRISDAGEIEIRPGDRIAQLVFTRVARPEFAIVAEFSDSGSRQESGFGSTGIEAACPDSLPG